MQRLSATQIVIALIGLAGLVWMIVDIVRLGWDGVPGSTYVCGVLGAILLIVAGYLALGGTPLVTENPNWESEAQQFEEQKKRDGVS